MDLYFNDCSIHGQFQDLSQFVDSLDTLMAMRALASKFGREIYCHRKCQAVQVTWELNLQQAVHYIDRNKSRVLMHWLAKAGPHWEDIRQHSNDEYLDCHDTVVTDTAIGECAFINKSGKVAELASITPSNWTTSPLTVIWRKSDTENETMAVSNHVALNTLEAALEAAPPIIQSWDQLARTCIRRFESLSFSADSFAQLRGTPFCRGAVSSIVDLLGVLDKLKTAFHDTGERNQLGHHLYQTYFTGKNAWFTDSSEQEKQHFEKMLTFKHPADPTKSIFATYHGKVQTPQIRIHFSWPISKDTPLYVLYVGPKLTKY